MILNNKEINLNLLQEECAEVIQVISKIRRFGLNDINPVDGVSNRDSLIQELEDVKIFIAAVKEDYNITSKECTTAYLGKMNRLQKWYNRI